MDHVAFVEVKLSDTREAALKAFNEGGRRHVPEVEECYMLAAHFDYLLKVRTQRYAAIIAGFWARSISTLCRMSAQSSTHVAMQAVKEDGTSL